MQTIGIIILIIAIIVLFYGQLASTRFFYLDDELKYGRKYFIIGCSIAIVGFIIFNL